MEEAFIKDIFVPYSFPSTLTSLPVLAAEIHHHSMMLPPPCFAVGIVSGRWLVMPGFFQRKTLELKPNSLILILLKQKVLFLTVRESFRCFFELQMGFHVFCTEERPVSNNSAIKPKSVAVLQWLLSFWNIVPSSQRLCGAQSEFQALGHLSH